MTRSISPIGHMPLPASLTPGLALAVVVGALFSGGLFSGCALDHATTATRYNCTAKIIAGDGVLRTISLPQMNLGGYSCAGSFDNSDNEPNRAQVRDTLRRFLNRALPACTDASCLADYGPAPWCVVPDDLHDVVLARAPNGNRLFRTPTAIETVDPLMPCSAETIAASVSCDDPGAVLAISAAPDPLGAAFGTAAVGSPSTRTFAVTNTGSGTLCLRRVAFSTGTTEDWQPQDATEAEQRCEPTPAEARTGFALLGAGHRSSCSVQVTFTPRDARASEATLVAESGNRGGAHGASLRLTGTGRGLSAAPSPQCFNVDEVPDPGRECRWFNRVVVTNTARRPLQITSAEVLAGDRLLPDGRPAWLDGVNLLRSTGAVDMVIPTAPTAAAPLTLTPGQSLVHNLRACLATGLPSATLRVQSGEAAGDLDVTLLPPDGCPHTAVTP